MAAPEGRIAKDGERHLRLSVSDQYPKLPRMQPNLPPPSQWPDKGSFPYTACFCEENVYWLAKWLHNAFPSPDVATSGAVVWISNAKKSVPIWRQRAGNSDGLVWWDYHCLLVLRRVHEPTLVFDFDSTLPFPCTLAEYQQHALLRSPNLPSSCERLYRVVPIQSFVRRFASDRSHMRDVHGGWLQPPPAYPCITAAVGNNTFPAYLDFPALAPPDQAENGMDAQLLSDPYGRVLSEQAFFAHFGLRRLPPAV